MSSYPIVIAEAGVNHNGNLERAKAMVTAAAEAGADIVKFQGFTAEGIVAAGAATADYQAKNTGARTQMELLRDLELSLEGMAEIAACCKQAGIEFLCTPFDIGMTGPLIGMGMKRIKVASGELTNHPALRHFAGFGLPVILSTGMAELAEVTAAVDVLKQAGCNDLLIMQCTSLYPAPAPTLNLRAIVTLREAFGCAVGFSDHSLGDHAAIASVALGASMIEKHFTLDRRLPGPDHLASLEPAELALMINRLRETADALGDGVKTPTPEERKVAALVRRSWHMARALPAGSRLGETDIVLKRPASGLPAHSAVLGRRLARALAADVPVTDADLERD